MEKSRLVVIGIFTGILLIAGGGVYFAEFAGGGEAGRSSIETPGEQMSVIPGEQIPSEPLVRGPEIGDVLERPEIAAYLEKLRERQDSKTRVSLADLFVEASKIATSLLDARFSHERGVPEIPGIHIRFDEDEGVLQTAVDVAFFRKLAEAHGVPDDLRFSDYIMNYEGGSLAGESKTPGQPCLRTEPAAMLAAVRAVKGAYRALKETPYAFFFEKTPGRLHINVLDDALRSFHCFCRSKSDVLADLAGLKNDVKGEEIETTVVEAIETVRDRDSYSFNGRCPAETEE